MGLLMGLRYKKPCRKSARLILHLLHKQNNNYFLSFSALFMAFTFNFDATKIIT